MNRVVAGVLWTAKVGTNTMRRYLPEDILFRPKMGFVTPIAAWLRGPLADEARGFARGGGALGGALGRTGWFDAARIAALAEAHITGTSDHSRLLWQLLMLDRSLQNLE